MTASLIITHSGTAHFDEVTAIGLILAANPTAVFRVERREPSPEELDDRSIWVVDTGGRHEPHKRNFDHHQSVDCRASFVLVADYLGFLSTLSVLPWWDFKDAVDRFGATRASQAFGAGDPLVNRSPVEDWLMRRFASDPDASLPLLQSLANQVILDAKSLSGQVEFWKKSRRLKIAGLPAAIGETRESFGLEEFRRLDDNPPDIIISLDREGEGWRLFRFDGAPVDFSLLSDREEIAFAHKTGFLAKTRERLPLDELVRLVGKAVLL
jgi:hypothetical protein